MGKLKRYIKKVLFILVSIILMSAGIRKRVLSSILESPDFRREIFERINQREGDVKSLMDQFFSREDSFVIMKKIFPDASLAGTRNKDTREEWLRSALQTIPRGSRILDAGAGELQYKKFCAHLDYVSQDFGGYDGAGNSIGLQMKTWDNSKLDIVSDIVHIPVPERSFDAIMCIEVFEHIPEPARAIQEFSRIIKSGGILIITAPFCSLTHFAPYYFGNGYSRFWYEKILKDAGFQILEITPNGNYFEYLAQEIRRIPMVAKEYAQDDLDKKEFIASSILLNMLHKMSLKDKGSSDLLNFGYHVIARKN